MTKTIYCAHPISGCSYDEVVGYYNRIRTELLCIGNYEVLHPMCGKDYLRNDIALKAQGYDHPLSTNHAIVARDHWMCQQCDILLINLVGSQRVSIGSVMEMAWCMHMGKHVVLVMEKGNIHEHAFVLECASVRYETEAEALAYLGKLAAMKV